MPKIGPGRDIIYGNYEDWSLPEKELYIRLLLEALTECDVYGRYAELLARANKPYLDPKDELAESKTP